ncbi:MAG: hypothetical protein ACRDAM_02865, partial [Casimicrobium sp.]
YKPGQKIRFRFTSSTGLHGTHCFSLKAVGNDQTLLIHLVDAEPQGRMRLLWPLVFAPLHDALIEDAFDNAQALFEPNIKQRNWSWYVRTVFLFRRFLKGALHR